MMHPSIKSGAGTQKHAHTPGSERAPQTRNPNRYSRLPQRSTCNRFVSAHPRSEGRRNGPFVPHTGELACVRQRTYVSPA